MPPPLKRGDYSPAKPTDLRSPCPGINALANHGYLPRDGRNVHATEIYNGLNEYGISAFVRYMFTHPIFLEHHPKLSPSSSQQKTSGSWITQSLQFLSNPFAMLFSAFGMRQPGQFDGESGVPCLNLDQLALHNVVEHDVSMTRLDDHQGDNCSPQEKLIQELLAAAGTSGGGDGRKDILTLDDFVRVRQHRYEVQARANPELQFGGLQLQIACTEVALVLAVFGDGTSVAVDRVRAFFQEGRLPRSEGWTRRWWTFGFLEMNLLAGKIKRKLGPVPPPGGQGTVPVVSAVH